MKKKIDFKSWVLVRDYNDQKWDLGIYGYYDEDCDQYVCVGGSYNQCILLKGNEYLLGTTDDYVKQWQPKDGDFVYVKCRRGHEYIYIQKRDSETGCYINIWIGNNSIGSSPSICNVSDIIQIRPATKEEKQQLLDALHKEGKDWDAEKKEIINYKWEPELGEGYWFVNGMAEPHKSSWYEDVTDLTRYNIGNCYKTKKEAQTIANKFKQLLKEK